ERDTGPRRGLVEDDGRGLRPGQRGPRIGSCLEFDGEVEDLAQFGRAEVGVLEEMACHGDLSEVWVSSAGDEAGQGGDERGEFLGGDGQRWGQAQTPGGD